jgi:hypothetical protein
MNGQAYNLKIKNKNYEMYIHALKLFFENIIYLKLKPENLVSYTRCLREFGRTLINLELGILHEHSPCKNQGSSPNVRGKIRWEKDPNFRLSSLKISGKPYGNRIVN